MDYSIMKIWESSISQMSPKNYSMIYFNEIIIKLNNMMAKNLNRIKVVLADRQKTNKWLAEQLGKDPATVSKWCTNSCQPSL